MIRTLLPLAIALSFIVAGCGDQQPGDQAKAHGPRLAFVTNNASDFWAAAKAGCAKAAEETGATLVFRIPGDGTAATQRATVDDLVASGIDGIAISPIDPQNQTDFLKGVAGKTLLITHDSDAPASGRVCYVGTDNVAAGRQAGELIKEALPQGGKVMVFVGNLDAQNARERLQGVKAAIAGSAIDIIDTRTDDTDRVRAKSNVSDALAKHPDLGCLVGLWSYNGPAILNAVREAGKTGTVKIVCFDEEEETLAGVEAGAIAGTIVQQPYSFGYEAITRMVKRLAGKADAFPASGSLIIPTRAIRGPDVAAFRAELHRLRGQ